MFLVRLLFVDNILNAFLVSFHIVCIIIEPIIYTKFKNFVGNFEPCIAFTTFLSVYKNVVVQSSNVVINWLTFPLRIREAQDSNLGP
jgi:hypothetical protein